MKSSFREFYPKEHHVERYIEENVMILMLRGVLRFEEDGTPQELTSGTWYVQRGGRYQTGLAESDSPYYFYIHFQGDMILSSNADVLPLSGTFSLQQLDPLLHTLDDLERKQLFCRFEKQILFLQLLDILGQMQQGQKSTHLSALMDHLSNHFTEPIDWKLLSSQFGYSYDHLIRLMRKEYGVTPHQYVMKLRINYAKHLLSSTDRTISLIALNCGYEDDSAFYRAFQMRTGMTPGDYRKSMKNL